MVRVTGGELAPEFEFFVEVADGHENEQPILASRQVPHSTPSQISLIWPHACFPNLSSAAIFKKS